VLREKFPDAQIDYLTKELYSEVLINNPTLSNLIIQYSNQTTAQYFELRTKLINNKYDLVIDLHNNFRTFQVRENLRLRGSKVLIFKKYSVKKKLLVWFKINKMKDLQPIKDRYIQTLSKLFPVNEYLNKYLPEIYTDEVSKQNVNKILTELGINKEKDLIGIIPVSKHFTKNYPLELYAELINKYDKEKYNFILAGKGNGSENFDIIKANTGSNVFDFYDKLTVLELAELMKHCSQIITGDTGPMHIAEALNIPIKMPAGSSVKEFGFYPQNKNAIVFEVNHLKCRPCSHIGRSECPLGHFKCMREITPEQLHLPAR
jgi:heptosyltransferase-2